jgi:hypothetical protein
MILKLAMLWMNALRIGSYSTGEFPRYLMAMSKTRGEDGRAEIE